VPDSTPETPEVGPSEARDLMADGAFLLDVREPDEWAAGHATDAVHIPMGQLGARQDELPTDRRIVAVCRSGGRSRRVTQALVGAGYDAVNLDGGMQAWIDVGLEMVSEDGNPPRVA